MKTIITTIIMLAACLTLQAKTDVARSVVIERTDGSTLQVNINSGLTVTFADGNAVIAGLNAAGEAINVTAPLADLKSWKLSDGLGAELSGIEDTVADGNAPQLDGMNLRGLTAGATVSVVDTAGRTVATVTAGADGTAALPFSSLSAGVYIVATPSGSFKIAVP